MMSFTLKSTEWLQTRLSVSTVRMPWGSPPTPSLNEVVMRGVPLEEEAGDMAPLVAVAEVEVVIHLIRTGKATSI